MSWRTSSPGIWLRNLGRALGVNRLIVSAGNSGYESRYDRLLSAAFRPGDIVWDVGANVGYYTVRFAQLVGPSGHVVAFEPSAVNFAHLRESSAGLPHVRLEPFGLGAKSGQVGFRQGDDDLGATSHISYDGEAGDRAEIRTADEEIEKGLPQPNVVKIDVEGYEGEVLTGMTRCLKSPLLRAIGVEVHFQILTERNLSSVPRQIERTLLDAGFNVSWPDNSHLLALR